MPNPTIAIEITSDASGATSGLRRTSTALQDVGRDARTASDRIESVGDTSGKTTQGLRDMADAVAMAGFPQLSAAMGVAAVGFEAIDGAATLFKATAGLLKTAVTQLATGMYKLAVAIWANPIFLIAAVIIAIVAVFVILYFKCEGFRKIVDKVFRAVFAVIKGVWQWIKDTFVKVYDFLKDPIEKAIAFVGGLITRWKERFDWIVEKITTIFAGVYHAIKDPFERAINWVRDHFHLPSLPSWLPGVGRSATAAAVGSPTALTRGAPRAGGGATAAPTVVVNVGVGDPHEIARQIRRILRDDSARLGRQPAWGGAL